MEPIIVLKACSVCTRVLDVERFRVFMRRGKRTHHAQCKNCESGESLRRQRAAKVAALTNSCPIVPPDGLWRGPVNHAPMVARL